mmetsp:Transcript_30972/g.75517  ORF Transcript_30972/g.75517 Transcript_30972/m.75517 type:complete len:706 (-) Transcript_30972:4668-6785(-)
MLWTLPQRHQNCVAVLVELLPNRRDLLHLGVLEREGDLFRGLEEPPIGRPVERSRLGLILVEPADELLYAQSERLQAAHSLLVRLARTLHGHSDLVNHVVAKRLRDRRAEVGREDEHRVFQAIPPVLVLELLRLLHVAAARKEQLAGTGLMIRPTPLLPHAFRLRRGGRRLQRERPGPRQGEDGGEDRPAYEALHLIPNGSNVLRVCLRPPPAVHVHVEHPHSPPRPVDPVVRDHGDEPVGAQLGREAAQGGSQRELVHAPGGGRVQPPRARGREEPDLLLAQSEPLAAVRERPPAPHLGARLPGPDLQPEVHRAVEPAELRPAAPAPRLPVLGEELEAPEGLLDEPVARVPEHVPEPVEPLRVDGPLRAGGAVVVAQAGEVQGEEALPVSGEERVVRGHTDRVADPLTDDALPQDHLVVRRVDVLEHPLPDLLGRHALDASPSQGLPAREVQGGHLRQDLEGEPCAPDHGRLPLPERGERGLEPAPLALPRVLPSVLLDVGLQERREGVEGVVEVAPVPVGLHRSEAVEGVDQVVHQPTEDRVAQPAASSRHAGRSGPIRRLGEGAVPCRELREPDAHDLRVGPPGVCHGGVHGPLQFQVGRAQRGREQRCGWGPRVGLIIVAAPLLCVPLHLASSPALAAVGAVRGEQGVPPRVRQLGLEELHLHNRKRGDVRLHQPADHRDGVARGPGAAPEPRRPFLVLVH